MTTVRSAPASARARVLVVEDSSVFREMQGLLLGQAGFAVASHERPDTALAAAADQRFDLVVIDYELPGMNGEQLMHRLRELQPELPVIFVSGSLTIELAIKLSSQGVAGIFNKPANPKLLLEKINETLFRQPRGSNSPLPAARCGSKSPFDSPDYAPVEPAPDQLAYAPRHVVGTSAAFREFTHRAWKVRDFRALLMLQGEIGSPFELFAHDLAAISIFQHGPVMACDAGEFEPRRLIEVLAPSLLSQDAGTLVLTGVESYTAAQQKTLEDLMAGRDMFLPFARRFRLILAATNELSERVDDGSFNDTLYYKISAVSLTVPSLRQMRGDIVANALRILEQNAARESAPKGIAVSADAAAWLTAQDWPGNYAQLEHTLLLALPYATGPELTLATFSTALRAYEASIKENTEPAPEPSSISARAPASVAG